MNRLPSATHSAVLEAVLDGVALLLAEEGFAAEHGGYAPADEQEVRIPYKVARYLFDGLGDEEQSQRVERARRRLEGPALVRCVACHGLYDEGEPPSHPISHLDPEGSPCAGARLPGVYDDPGTRLGITAEIVSGDSEVTPPTREGQA